MVAAVISGMFGMISQAMAPKPPKPAALPAPPVDPIQAPKGRPGVPETGLKPIDLGENALAFGPSDLSEQQQASNVATAFTQGKGELDTGNFPGTGSKAATGFIHNALLKQMGSGGTISSSVEAPSYASAYLKKAGIDPQSHSNTAASILSGFRELYERQ